MLQCGSQFFFFNDTATTEIYTLSLHDALPISSHARGDRAGAGADFRAKWSTAVSTRSEEHTSELQSHLNLVCRLLLEKKKNFNFSNSITTLYMLLHNVALIPLCPHALVHAWLS